MRFRPLLVRSLILATAGAAVLGFAPAASGVTRAAGPPPNSMAALGDSISRGFDACGFYVDCPSQSWSTGDDGQINSHYQRIRAVNPAISGHAFNDAKSGGLARDVVGQANTAVSQGVQYVTILIGANDACQSSESAMTPVDVFTGQLNTILDRINQGLPAARIFVASIPNIKQLWAVEKDNFFARFIWGIAGICQSMLANPTSNAPADQARRDRVLQRVIDYNAVLAQTCGRHSNCLFDNNAVFDYSFPSNLISGWDYFHPNPAGQATLAAITYAAGYRW